jgi:hypothetical protein
MGMTKSRKPPATDQLAEASKYAKLVWTEGSWRGWLAGWSSGASWQFS